MNGHTYTQIHTHILLYIHTGIHTHSRLHSRISKHAKKKTVAMHWGSKWKKRFCFNFNGLDIITVITIFVIQNSAYDDWLWSVTASLTEKLQAVLCQVLSFEQATIFFYLSLVTHACLWNILSMFIPFTLGFWLFLNNSWKLWYILSVQIIRLSEITDINMFKLSKFLFITSSVTILFVFFPSSLIYL